MMMTSYEALVHSLLKALEDGVLTREEVIYLAKVARGDAGFLSDEDIKKAVEEALDQVDGIMKCSIH
jgi:hypothetical protein